MMETADPTLFDSIQVGALTLPNRIVMTAMTRTRADADEIPSPLMIEYYRQRASAGLIISEGIAPSPMGRGYIRTPGIYTEEQRQGWTKVTKAVHDAGGRIQAQLWHVGRISHPSMLPGGVDPFAPSAIAAENSTIYSSQGFLPCARPAAMTKSDIRVTIEEFAAAAKRSMAAGFDGVQIHAGNGYLPDQFLRDGSNHRDDEYGGSIANRVRFLTELVEAVCDVVKADRVSVRIAPTSRTNGMFDSNPLSLFTEVVRALNPFGLAFLDVVEGETVGPRDVGEFDPQVLRRAYDGLYLGNNSYTPELAADAVRQGSIDLIGFGRLFITNPDLIERLRNGAPVAAPGDRETFYGDGAKNYVDFPSYAETS